MGLGSAAAAQLTWKRFLRDSHLLHCLNPLQVLDAARGMLYLHRRSVPVLHRDLVSAPLRCGCDCAFEVADGVN